MTALETRFEAILPTLATKADVASLRSEMEQANLRLSAKFDAKFDGLRAEIQQVELRMNARLDAKFDESRADMLKMNSDIKSWALATMIAIIGTVLAGFLGISQFYRSPTPRATTAPTTISLPVSLPASAAAEPKSILTRPLQRSTHRP